MNRYCLLIAVAGCIAPTGEPEISQTPPVLGMADIERWLADAWYLEWTCEGRSSVGVGHSFNRICSNGLAVAAGPGEFPVDAASVKEMRTLETGPIVGFAVSRHTRPGDGGDTWYWYERVPLDSPLPHDADGIAANGWGDFGGAIACVQCHRAAGSDADHTGHDLVYTVAR